MKILAFIFLLTLTGHLTSGQNKPIQQDELLFEKARLLSMLATFDLDLERVINSDSSKIRQELAGDVMKTILDKSLGFYTELTVNYPKSKFLLLSLESKAIIEFSLDKKQDAKNTYQKILYTVTEDQQDADTVFGRSQEQFTPIKNRAAKVLAEMSLQENNFTEALEYLDETKKYPYKDFCGNGYTGDEIYMSELYAKCYLGLNNDQKALKVLLPHLIENGLAGNSSLVELTYKTLLKQNSKEELRVKFEKAFRNYQTEKVKSKEMAYEKYYITFLDTKIELPSWEFESMKPKERQKGIEEIYKNSKFYSLLND